MLFVVQKLVYSRKCVNTYESYEKLTGLPLTLITRKGVNVTIKTFIRFSSLNCRFVFWSTYDNNTCHDTFMNNVIKETPIEPGFT